MAGTEIGEDEGWGRSREISKSYELKMWSVNKSRTIQRAKACVLPTGTRALDQHLAELITDVRGSVCAHLGLATLPHRFLAALGNPRSE
jgi:hypothetical protein